MSPASAVVLTADHDGALQPVAGGQDVHVLLPEIPTSGFLWDLQVDGPAAVVDSRFEPGGTAAGASRHPALRPAAGRQRPRGAAGGAAPAVEPGRAGAALVGGPRGVGLSARGVPPALGRGAGPAADVPVRRGPLPDDGRDPEEVVERG